MSQATSNAPRQERATHISGGANCRVGLDRATEYKRIVDSFDVFAIPADIRALILEALHSDRWDWFRDCDGCTCVSELFWPTIYFPPCVRHDYDCRVHNGFAASRRFYRIQRAYGVTAFRSGIRAAGVYLAYLAWYRWRK